MYNHWADLLIKSDDDTVKHHRVDLAKNVIDWFNNQYPFSDSKKVLCFIDDTDGYALRQFLGPNNRGLFALRNHEICRLLPPDFRMALMETRGDGSDTRFDSGVYIYNSTCNTDIGLTLCLSHELQHFIQYVFNHISFKINNLFVPYSRKIYNESKQKIVTGWHEIPTEIEARLISKRIALTFFREDDVYEFINEKIFHSTDTEDAADWEFVKSLDTKMTFDLTASTKERLFEYKDKLIEYNYSLEQEERFIKNEEIKSFFE